MQQQPSDRVARTVGVLFILTFVTSIAGYALYSSGGVLDGGDFARGDGSVWQVQAGAFLEVLLVIVNAGTAIALYPVSRKISQSVAIGYVATRMVESVLIAVGIVSLLSVVTLREKLGASGVPAAESLVALHEWTFVLGPSFCAGFGNGILLGYLMYKSGLVPRRMAMIGLVGGPLAFVGAVFVLFGAFSNMSDAKFFFTAPEIVWEASFGIYLTAKGFRKPAAAVPAPRAVAVAAA